MAEANKARYESDRANMQAVFTTAVAKVMTHNRATVNVMPGPINTFTSGVTQSPGSVIYNVTNAMNKEHETGKIVFDKGDNTDTEFYTGKQLPIYAAGITKWYVDEEGRISLEVAGTKYGEGEIVSAKSIMKNWDQYDSEDFHQEMYREAITKIVFKSDTTIPDDVTSWDISEAGNGSVIAYVEVTGSATDATSTDESTNVNARMLPPQEFIPTEYYTLTIGGNGKVYANMDSSYLFFNFSRLETIENLNLLDTSNTVYMNNMFELCEKLTTLNANNFDTSKVVNMANMFYLCGSLSSLNVSNWNTKNVEDMSVMFTGCGELETLNLNSWDTGKVMDMRSMFAGCEGLETLNVSLFDTSSVLGMEELFSGCRNLKVLDLSNWNTKNTENMWGMFDSCDLLQEITIGVNFLLIDEFAYFPVPNPDYITGTDGYWHNSAGETFAGNAIPANKADTYYAIPQS